MTDILETLEARAKTHGDFTEVAFISQTIKTLINQSKVDLPNEEKQTHLFRMQETHERTASSKYHR